MRKFLKSLCFWTYYRDAYEHACEHNLVLDARLADEKQRVARALDELRRLNNILAPYGERILTGQAKDTEGAIRLPVLEFAMARAFLNTITRWTHNIDDAYLLTDYQTYSWRGRLVMAANPVQRPVVKSSD